MRPYTVLLAIEIALAIIVTLVAKQLIKLKPLLLTGVCVTIITLIFDSWLTAWPIVQYNNGAISGIHIGTIPIEDFGYTLLACLIVPIIFEAIHGHQENHPNNSRDNTDQSTN